MESASSGAVFGPHPQHSLRCAACSVSRNQAENNNRYVSRGLEVAAPKCLATIATFGRRDPASRPATHHMAAQINPQHTARTTPQRKLRRRPQIASPENRKCQRNYTVPVSSLCTEWASATFARMASMSLTLSRYFVGIVVISRSSLTNSVYKRSRSATSEV